MLPQTCEETHLFYEGLVAYAAARRARLGSERVLLKAMNARHADIIVKLFQNAPEDHAEVEEYFRECIRLVAGERHGVRAIGPLETSSDWQTHQATRSGALPSGAQGS